MACIVDGGMTADDIEVHALPLYHGAQLDCFFSLDVYLGATSVILPGPHTTTSLKRSRRSMFTKLFAPPPVATILQPWEQISRAGSAGGPILNVETRVVDDHDLSVPAGTVGEIAHRSPQATLGYYNAEKKTAEASETGVARRRPGRADRRRLPQRRGP